MRLLSFLLTLTLILLFGSTTFAAPEAHILRIDPRTSQNKGAPVLTSVIEVVQTKRISDATVHCANARGSSLYSCMSAALEKPYALYTPFSFPHQKALFSVKVGGTPHLAKYVSHAKWGDSLQQPGVGTAWLVLIDADSRIRGGFDDAKAVASRFVSSMGPNDIVNVMFFNDRQVVKDSKWIVSAQKNRALSTINSVSSTYRSQGRNRSLLTIIKNAATDGFKALGNVGENVPVPLHQAMVVLSTGFGGTDPSTTGPGAIQLQKYMTGGRFPETNTALPKAPVPVISIWFPHRTYDEFKQNSMEFMQNMANPEIGGFFTIVQGGGGGRAANIVNAVRARFARMQIVKWRAACIEPSPTQTFSLNFNDVKPPILGDNSFKEVPVGIDPTAWPLDVNTNYTQEMVKRDEGVYPGGTFKVYGDFCWGGDKSRAEVYFLPAGQQLPTALAGANIEQAKRTQQQLIAMGMKGKAIEASDTYVTFEVPDEEKILHGSGNAAVVRVVIYDNVARRTSGVTADSIVQLKGTTRPFPIMWVLGGAFALVVLALLVVVIVRSGGRGRAAPPPPPPPQPPYGGGYGSPPGGGGYNPQGGGYGAPPAGGGYPPPGGGGYPPPGGGGYGAAATPAPAVAAAANPAGAGAGAGAAPAAPSPEFLYGNQEPKVGITNDIPAGTSAPPPNPYASGPETTSRATLQGSAGVFTVMPGVEMKAGRDGSQCGILLSEPRVSAVHATLKVEGGQLLVRDEQSNNGTLVNGNRLSAGVWNPVTNGSLIRFGPVEFSVRLE